MTKKTYIKGYKYSFNRKSLIRPTCLVLENNLPYGKGKLEAMIIYELGTYHVLITDGYNWIDSINGMKQSLKTVINIVHGKLEAITLAQKTTIV